MPTLVGMACILAIMTSMLVSACDSGGNDGSPNPLIPLEKGNQWEYVFTSEDFEPTYQDRIDLVSDTKAVYSSSYTFERPPILVDKTEEGTLIRGEEDDPGEYPVMLLKYPVEEGESYEHTDGEGSTFEVTVTKETVTVPAGEYDCLLYTIRDFTGIEAIGWEIWIKPGMGPVRVARWGGNEVWELTSTNVDS